MSYNTELQENNADLQEILDKVNALPEAGGGVELPELTNPGAAGDLAYGKELIDSEGNVVIGTLSDSKAHSFGYTIDELSSFAGGSLIQISGTNSIDSIIRAGSMINGTISSSKFGDASVDDVAEGKTFTSAAGLKKTGTLKALDTSDATATAEQMAEGVTAYVNGEKVTGTAKTVRGSYSKTVTPSFTSAAGGAIKLIQMMDTIAEPTFFGTTGATGLTLQAQASEFGDAEPSDVTKGKTFTSAAGLKAVGTKEESGGGTSNVQTCTVKLDNESVSDDCDILAIVATVFEDGIFKTHAAFASDLLRGEGFGTSVTLHNVVCNTKIYLIAYIANYSKVGAYVEIDGSATLESDASIIEVYDQALLTFTAPSASGEECTIYYSYNV